MFIQISLAMYLGPRYVPTNVSWYDPECDVVTECHTNTEGACLDNQGSSPITFGIESLDEAWSGSNLIVRETKAGDWEPSDRNVELHGFIHLNIIQLTSNTELCTDRQAPTKYYKNMFQLFIPQEKKNKTFPKILTWSPPLLISRFCLRLHCGIRNT